MGHSLCPRCGQQTTMMRLPATADEELAWATLHERFMTHYMEREARRIAEGWIAPEALGKREARQIIELERKLAVGPEAD